MLINRPLFGMWSRNEVETLCFHEMFFLLVLFFAQRRHFCFPPGRALDPQGATQLPQTPPQGDGGAWRRRRLGVDRR